MTIHILQNGHYSVVRCHNPDVDALRSALEEKGFQCGQNRPVDGIDSMVDINIKRNGSWGNISEDDIRAIAVDAGLNVA
jgi:hypothetical protein